MITLSTIQKREKLNDVAVIGETGPGGACHEYLVRWGDSKPSPHEEREVGCIIRFQKGPRLNEDSQHGVIDSDLLEIVRHRLQCFQQGEYATRENEIALTHIEEALLWMNKRVEDRIERNVLGTYEK